MTTKVKGDAGEDLAANWLREKGYHIVKRNLRCPSGEVDIVVYRDACLAFVEVKTWQSFTVEELEHSIHAEKRRKIINCARFFLGQHSEWNGFRTRFDIVHIDSSRTIRHFPDAFTESGFL